MENAVNSVIVFFDQVVARYVKNYQPLELFKCNYLLDIVDLIVAKIKLH